MNIHELLYNDDYSSLDEAAKRVYENDGITDELKLKSGKRINETLYTFFPGAVFNAMKEEISQIEESIDIAVQNHFPEIFVSGREFAYLHDNVRTTEDRDRVMMNVIDLWSHGCSTEKPDVFAHTIYVGGEHIRLLTPYFYRPIPQDLLKKTIKSYKDHFSVYPIGTPPFERTSFALELFDEVKDIFSEFALQYTEEIRKRTPALPPSESYKYHKGFWDKNVYIRHLEQLQKRVGLVPSQNIKSEYYLIKELESLNKDIFIFDLQTEDQQQEIIEAARKRQKKSRKKKKIVLEPFWWRGTESELSLIYQILVDTTYINDDDYSEFRKHFWISVSEPHFTEEPTTSRNRIAWIKPRTVPDLMMLFFYLEKKDLIWKKDDTTYLWKPIQAHFCDGDGEILNISTLKSAHDRILDNEKKIPSGKPRFMEVIQRFEKGHE